MAKMENPEVEAVRFENEDVIATSPQLWYNAATKEWTSNDPTTQQQINNGQNSGLNVQNGPGSPDYTNISQYDGVSGHWRWNGSDYVWVGNQ